MQLRSTRRSFRSTHKSFTARFNAPFLAAPSPQRLLRSPPITLADSPTFFSTNTMKFLLLFSFILLTSYFSLAVNPDVVHLMKLKSSADRLGSLKSWNAAVDPCSGRWLGVSCVRGGGRVSRLVLEGLNLAGSLESLTSLPNLRFLSLHNNSFIGDLHLLDFATWQPHMKVLHLSSNRFTGHFPSSFLRLHRLRRLDLAGNLFSGAIPPEVGIFLHHLLTMRLERNLFTGKIPTSISKISNLSDFNVSYNFLSGEIPPSLSHFPASSFKSNPGLFVSDIITSDPAPPPPSSENGRQDLALTATTIAIVAAAVVSMAAGFWIYKLRRDNRKHESADTQKSRGGGGMVVFEGCKKFEVDELMRGSAEMLGRGTAGTTYRVVMEEETNGEGVAVKRIRREGGGRRKDEEAVLGEMARWRHPNVVSLRGYYATDEELLLVFDYVAGGSLYSLLHGYRGPGRRPLEWPARLRLASDAANGLAYLHKSSKIIHSHCHLASSNILIAGDGSALISDYGLIRLQHSPPSPSSSSHRTAITTTTTTKSQKSDVYSFGIILLEILTGRTKGERDMDLDKWVQTVVREEWTSEVFDFEMLRQKDMEDEMVALLQIALLCLSRDPKDRPRMSLVHQMIEEIRERGSRRGRGSQTPSVNEHSYESSSPYLSEDTTVSPLPSC